MGARAWGMGARRVVVGRWRAWGMGGQPRGMGGWGCTCKQTRRARAWGKRRRMAQGSLHYVWGKDRKMGDS